MPTFLVDRVQETTAVTGTGSATLLGATTGYLPFSYVGNGNSTYYCITVVGGTDWEIGLGTYSTSGPTLSRDTVYSNSLGTTAKISFSAGTKNVFVTSPTALLSKLLVPQALVISNGTAILIKQNNINGTIGIADSGGWLFPQAITLSKFTATVTTAPKGNLITIPIKYGSTYATSTLLRTLIIANNAKSFTVTDTTKFNAQTYMYLDITGVGSTYPGAGLRVQVDYTYTPIT